MPMMINLCRPRTVSIFTLRCERPRFRLRCISTKKEATDSDRAPNTVQYQAGWFAVPIGCGAGDFWAKKAGVIRNRESVTLLSINVKVENWYVGIQGDLARFLPV